MMDPVEIGIRIHSLIMSRIAEYVDTEKDLLEIGRMIDILVGSAQVVAVEKGLGRTPEEYRAAISEKLKSLGLEV